MRVAILWIGILSCLLGGGSLIGVHPGVFFQPVAMIQVFGPIAITLVYLRGFPGSFYFISQALKNRITPFDWHIVERIVQVGFLAGTFSFICGLVHVMQNLADSSRIGNGIAIAFIGVVYGLLPALLFSPMQTMSASKKEKAPHSFGYAAAGVAGLLFLLLASLFALSQGTPTA